MTDRPPPPPKKPAEPTYAAGGLIGPPRRTPFRNPEELLAEMRGGDPGKTTGLGRRLIPEGCELEALLLLAFVVLAVILRLVLGPSPIRYAAGFTIGVACGLLLATIRR